MAEPKQKRKLTPRQILERKRRANLKAALRGTKIGRPRAASAIPYRNELGAIHQLVISGAATYEAAVSNAARKLSADTGENETQLYAKLWQFVVQYKTLERVFGRIFNGGEAVWPAIVAEAQQLANWGEVPRSAVESTSQRLLSLAKNPVELGTFGLDHLFLALIAHRTRPGQAVGIHRIVAGSSRIIGADGKTTEQAMNGKKLKKSGWPAPKKGRRRKLITAKRRKQDNPLI